MAWEYKTVEMTDFGHPGGLPRFQDLADELAKQSQEGWEIEKIVPTMSRGRAETAAGAGKETSSLTVVAILVFLKRKVESPG